MCTLTEGAPYHVPSSRLFGSTTRKTHRVERERKSSLTNKRSRGGGSGSDPTGLRPIERLIGWWEGRTSKWVGITECHDCR